MWAHTSTTSGPNNLNVCGAAPITPLGPHSTTVASCGHDETIARHRRNWDHAELLSMESNRACLKAIPLAASPFPETQSDIHQTNQKKMRSVESNRPCPETWRPRLAWKPRLDLPGLNLPADLKPCRRTWRPRLAFDLPGLDMPGGLDSPGGLDMPGRLWRQCQLAWRPTARSGRANNAERPKRDRTVRPRKQCQAAKARPPGQAAQTSLKHPKRDHTVRPRKQRHAPKARRASGGLQNEPLGKPSRHAPHPKIAQWKSTQQQTLDARSHDTDMGLSMPPHRCGPVYACGIQSAMPRNMEATTPSSCFAIHSSLEKTP